MNPWTKRLFLVLSIGGGFGGVIVMFTAFPSVEGQIAGYVLLSGIIAAFIFGIYSGIRLAEDEHSGLRLLRWFFALQAPIVSSSIVTYQMSAGAGFGVSFIGSNINFYWHFGSQMAVFVFRDFPFGIGVNALAVILFIWCERMLRKIAEERRCHPTPPQLVVEPPVAPGAAPE